MSLHRILSLFVVALAALVLGAAVSLVLLTTYLHRSTVELETALQSVRVAEEMQIDLLKYISSDEPEVRINTERELRNKLQQAHQFVTAPEEEQYLLEAERLIEAHLAKAEASPGIEISEGDLQRSFAALRGFVDLNVHQADASMRESEEWDDFGDRIGIGFSVVLIVGMAAMLIWIRRVAFQPVFEIQEAIRNFAVGRKDTRAPEYGPEELSAIARQFNEMAVALARQHENQVAFLAAVAHDLRNPLGALKTAADILSSDRKLPPETVSNVMEVVKRQVHGLDRMIGDLLDTSRIEAGQLELRVKDCDLRAIAQASFDLFNSGSSEYQLKLSLPDDPVHVHCDPLRIEQVINNLLSNAIKYSPRGSRIEVALKRANDQALIWVSDEGVGIAREDLPYIFEPFRRTAASREEVPGVGLGLSVAQRIVRAHGGAIHVESQTGRGSTFRVHLPAEVGVPRVIGVRS